MKKKVSVKESGESRGRRRQVGEVPMEEILKRTWYGKKVVILSIE